MAVAPMAMPLIAVSLIAMSLRAVSLRAVALMGVALMDMALMRWFSGHTSHRPVSQGRASHRRVLGTFRFSKIVFGKKS